MVAQVYLVSTFLLSRPLAFIGEVSVPCLQVERLLCSTFVRPLCATRRLLSLEAAPCLVSFLSTVFEVAAWPRCESPRSCPHLALSYPHTSMLLALVCSGLVVELLNPLRIKAASTSA